MEDPSKYDANFIKSKRNLLQFIDIAIEHGYGLPSKRGRKTIADKQFAIENSILAPTNLRPISSNNLQNPRENERISIIPNPVEQPFQNFTPVINMTCIYPIMPAPWNHHVGIPMSNYEFMWRHQSN